MPTLFAQHFQINSVLYELLLLGSDERLLWNLHITTQIYLGIIANLCIYIDDKYELSSLVSFSVCQAMWEMDT